jgi:hypothetical protein
MDNRSTQLDVLLQLETRHEDLLRRLDELDKRVEKALAECQAYWKPADSNRPLLRSALPMIPSHGSGARKPG